MFHPIPTLFPYTTLFRSIELLVVILIIGILAAIAIPSFLNQKSKANDASAKSQARTMQTARAELHTANIHTLAKVALPQLQETEVTLKDHTVNEPTVPKA